MLRSNLNPLRITLSTILEKTPKKTGNWGVL
jgi:hypothetical protein